MTTNRQPSPFRVRGAGQERRVSAGILAASFLTAYLLFWILPDIFEPWNARTVDRLFDLRASFQSTRPRYDSTIVHVDITDKTMDTLKQHYLNRSHFALAVENLRAMQVAVQAWDFIFSWWSEDAKTDSAFFQATARAGNVYYGSAFSLLETSGAVASQSTDSSTVHYVQRQRWNIDVEGDAAELLHAGAVRPTFRELAVNSKGLGFLNINPDPDGVLRKACLVIEYQGGWYPSLPFLVICQYLRVQPESIEIRPGRTIRLKNAVYPDGHGTDIVIPIDDRGMMIVNYVGPWERMKHYNVATILRASEDQMDLQDLTEELSGKIIVVSQVTTGSADVGPVPTDKNFPYSGVHANVMHTILTGNFLTELHAGRMLLVEAALLLSLFLLSLRASSVMFSAGAVGLLIVYLVVCSGLFLYANLILNVVRPSMMLLFGTFSVLAHRYVREEKQKESLRHSFEAYFPAPIVKKIMAEPELITAGAQKKELTVLFSDIKSFTTYSSTMQPDDIHRLLNEYFEAMVDIVFKWGGTVDKFIGDGLMVFFGDPEPQNDHAIRCVKASMEMQKKCRELRKKWVAQGYFPLQVRIGINTGEVVVGNMGSQKRLSYTVLGSDVNLAQRLEANAPADGIMLSRRTYEMVKDHLPVKPHEPITVKGLEHPVEVYLVTVED